MPIRNFNLEELAKAEGFPTLPLHYEFIVGLYNDGYSVNTIYNYYRDLVIFALFLQDMGIEFKDLKVEHITFYKGWLKSRKHIKLIKKILEKNSAYKKTSEQISAEEKKNSAESAEKIQKYFGGFIKNSNPSKLTANSVNRMLVSFRRYLRFLIETGEKVPILPDQVKLVRTEKKILHVPELEHIVALVEAPSKVESNEIIAMRNRAMLEVLLATGMRISELLSLNREQVDNSLELYIKGKGRKERVVYLTPRAKKYVDKYLDTRQDPYPALFVPLWVHKRFSGRSKNINANVKTEDPRIKPNYLQGKIAEYRRVLKLPAVISAHTIRHAFATYMIENGANVEAVRILLGHESLNTTTKYVNAAQEFAKKQHIKMHPVQE